MERCGPGLAYEEPAERARQQERHYQLLSELQALVKGLPSAVAELLYFASGYPLLPGTALLQIARELLKVVFSEMGYLTSKQEMFHKHKEAQQSCKPHNLPVLKAAQQRELEAVEQRIREEQRLMDEKIVLELDQKVVDQQSTLEKAGVSGFYITTNPQELTLQMNLLELIRKLQQKESQPEKAFS
uniref:DGCR6 protein n=1 Tax=Gopherus agassizii TaxID=38772 RepID=A0A452IW89_9SAUR